MKISTKYGKIRLINSKPVVVNSFCSLRFQYTVGRIPWKQGGKLYICDRHDSDWSKAQTSNPCGDGYTTVKGSRECYFLTRYDHWYNMLWHPWQHIFEIILEKGELDTDDTIVITYGDRSKGSFGIRAQSFVEPNFKFRVFVDPQGTGKFHELNDKTLSFSILSGDWNLVKVIVPTKLEINEEKKIRIRALDQYGNTTYFPTKSDIYVICQNKDVIKINRQKLNSRKKLIEISTKKILGKFSPERIEIKLISPDYETKSNPSQAKGKNEPYIFWGEIHSQSYICDGTRTPEELFNFARDEAGLDFAAVTSHDCGMLSPEKDFDIIIKAANKSYVPNKFVTFIGFEWSGLTEFGGDHNIYFSGTDGKIFNSGHIINQIKNMSEEIFKQSTIPPWAKKWMFDNLKYRDLKDVYNELNPEQAIVIPHGGGRIANLEYHNPELESVIEIFSSHQSHEFLAFESLIRGYRMGFIAGSDDHRGALGDSYPTWRNEQINFTEHSGLIAVYANELTRESIWKAIKEKRVYATSGERIILEFKVNSRNMGESILISNPDIPREIFIRVFGTNYIRQIELWRNCELIHIWSGRKLELEKKYIDRIPIDELKWIDKTLWMDKSIKSEKTVNGISIKRADAVYFVKVIQVDGHMAWSSPVWIDLK